MKEYIGSKSISILISGIKLGLHNVSIFVKYKDVPLNDPGGLRAFISYLGITVVMILILFFFVVLFVLANDDSVCRWPGTVRSASSSETLHRSVVSRHGFGHSSLQDQTERHPGAVQGRHQTDVCFLNWLRSLAGVMAYCRREI